MIYNKEMKFGKWGIIILTLFTFYSILVIAGVFNNADQLITVGIQNTLTTAFDTPLSILSLIGSVEVTSILLIIIVFILKLKKSLIVMFTFAFGMVIELMGKTFIFHPDPPKTFLRYDLDIFLPSGLVRTGYSYPSGHSFRTAFLCLIICYLIYQSKSLSIQKKKFYSLLSFFFLFMMLLSRVSLGEHWTTDVIGGCLLGLGFACISIFVVEHKTQE